jgi:hypothetical protein
MNEYDESKREERSSTEVEFELSRPLSEAMENMRTHLLES